MKSLSKFIHFHSRKCVWKCRLENGGHIVSASMCLKILLFLLLLMLLVQGPVYPSQYIGNWWPGDTMNHGISSCHIDKVLSQYSGLCTKIVNCVLLTIHSLIRAHGVDIWAGMNSATHVWLFVIVFCSLSVNVSCFRWLICVILTGVYTVFRVYCALVAFELQLHLTL